MAYQYASLYWRGDIIFASKFTPVSQGRRAAQHTSVSCKGGIVWKSQHDPVAVSYLYKSEAQAVHTTILQASQYSVKKTWCRSILTSTVERRCCTGKSVYTSIL